MQNFPISLSADFSAPALPAKAAELAGAAPFAQVFSSFIQEGREDYCGLPEGFPALETDKGTLSRETTDLFKKALQDRDIPADALESLDQLNASGLPATVGRIFSVLAGRSRATAALEGDERLNFIQLLGKIGFSKEQAEDILGLCDEGKTGAAWKRLSEKLRLADGEEAELHVSELSALLAGLELPEATRRQILTAFGGQDSLTLRGEELEALLAAAGAKMAAREKAREGALKVMREAMTQALEEGKRKERNDPVADARGSRESERSLLLMRDSARGKAGDPLAAPAEDPARSGGSANSRKERADAAGEEPTEERRGEKGGEELAPTPEKRSGSARTKGGEDPQNRPSIRVETAAPAAAQGTQAEARPATAQELYNPARSFQREIFSQVESGLLQQARDGASRLTLDLNPGELGRITLILSVKQGEVKAVLRAENEETAAVLADQLAELRTSLENQGLKVAELDVQTQTQGNDLAWQWGGPREHNLTRDARERARQIRLSLLRREAGAALPDMEQRNRDGWHIVA